ncbi:MAG: 5' nucleotidase, NT5C type [Thermoplasmatota archaeon]
MTERTEDHPDASALRIAVDFDGVLFDHVPYILRGFRDAYGIDLEEEGMRFWDFFQYRAVREKDLTWKCVARILAAVETDLELHREPPRDPRCQAILGRWRDDGHVVEIVTARGSDAREATELFLRHHGIPHDRLRMGISKKVGWDVLVDDAPHNVLMAAADGGLALLVDHPYNRDVPTHTNPRRIVDFEEADAAIRARAPIAVTL